MYKYIQYFIYKLIQLVEYFEYFNKDLDQDDVDKKIMDSISLSGYEVLSDTGYVDMFEIHKTQPYRSYRVTLENGLSIECADNHILFNDSLDDVFVIDLKKDDLIFTEFGTSRVLSVEYLGYSLSMFDISVGENHRYYTNNILSHNTINSAITILHFITFNNDKNAMIVANIAATTIEIIDKIKAIYVLLPFFLKVPIKNWNQRSMICGNGCRIKSAARSKTPAIGFTIDLLYMDEFAHIPSNIIEPYYTAVFPTVSAIQNSKIIITSTPNGMNLFHKLLLDAERPSGDPLKNNYRSMRVYWHQVPGRFVTYIRLNDHRMYSLGIDRTKIFEYIKELYGDKTRVEMKFSNDDLKYTIHIFNNDSVTEEDVRSTIYIDDGGNEYNLNSFSEITTWKKEAIKDIGGEDAFNQEYDLRFINASRSLLTESVIEKLLDSKVNYVYRDIEEFSNRLKFVYDGLTWIDDENVFNESERKDICGVISVDISEGLGQDYSVINIFKIDKKTDDVIERDRPKYTSLSDFFCLKQIGMYRSNYISVKQLAELFYILAFEYFNPDNFKVVLEINAYGNEFLAHLPHVFDGSNNYGSSIFFKYKHRADATEEKIGLKVTENKNILVKEYQTRMSNGSVLLNNEDNIREVTTFVKHTTSAGNTRYAADIGNDDIVMTVVNLSSCFEKYNYKELVEDYVKRKFDPSFIDDCNKFLDQNIDYTETTDYESFISVSRRIRAMKQLNNRLGY